MVKTEANLLLKQLESIRNQLRARFSLIDSAQELPKPWGGNEILHIEVNPKIAFYFLEFIFEFAYLDIMLEAGLRFIDDKTTWEYFVKTKDGFLRIYDWKGYTVSVGSFGPSNETTQKKLNKDAEFLKNFIESNIGKFDKYKDAEYKSHLEKYPFDNFMDAFISLTLLFRDAYNELDNARNYLEALILLVSLLDTQLRYSILLTRINTRKTKKIDPDFWELFQQTDEKFLSEQRVYSLAEKEVDFPNYDKSQFFKRIRELYKIRNRAVHRFAITNFQYKESKAAVEKYRDLVDILFTIIEDLEHEQVRLGVGFIKQEELDLPEHELRMEVIRAVSGKIDSKALIPRTKEREPMFSDKYPDGYHPGLKEVMNKIEKELMKKRQSEPKK